MPTAMGLPAEIEAAFRKGDPRCEFAIGRKVMKLDGDAGDMHAPGTQGEVTGNKYVEHEGVGMECYLVQFNGTPVETFIIKPKLIGL